MKLETAIKARDDARARMARATAGSPMWKRAEADLNFWQGKVAMLEALKASCPRR